MSMSTSNARNGSVSLVLHTPQSQLSILPMLAVMCLTESASASGIAHRCDASIDADCGERF